MSTPDPPKGETSDELRLWLHDLANSAAGMSGILMLLRTDGGDPVMLDQACQVAGHLVDEIDLLRSFVREGSGEDGPGRRRIGLEDILAPVFIEGQGLAVAAGCRLQCSAPCTADVEADPRLLHRAMLNLLKNAIEACPKSGMVRVQTCILWRRARLEVWHPGSMPEPGRPAAMGRGLGLRSVRRVVALHPGMALGSSSSPELGTSYWLDLPML